MTAREVIQQAYLDQPYLKLAVNAKENAIGSWSNELGRYVCVAFQAILSDDWRPLPYEMLVDGKPMSEEWTEVAK